MSSKAIFSVYELLLVVLNRNEFNTGVMYVGVCECVNVWCLLLKKENFLLNNALQSLN